MKDLPHHIKKLNRRIIRSVRREEVEEELPEVPTWSETEREKKKKEKRKLRAEGLHKTSHHPSPEERNKIMKKGRVPVFDRESAKPKHAPPSKKKTPHL